MSGPQAKGAGKRGDMQGFNDFIGRKRVTRDILDPARVNALDIALGGGGSFARGDALPLLDHWLHFWEVKPPGELGEDGHPAKGGFLPPIPLPRRMWAGGRLSFYHPLILGDAVEKTSTIVSITEKSGSSGPLVFVTLRHEYADENGVAVSEEQDLVYREAAAKMQPLTEASPPPDATWQETINPDTVLLFRYSALTMNGHRIHYDRPYASDAEYYPRLVIHGPLQAKLMMRLSSRGISEPVKRFSFRGQSPAYEGMPLHIGGNADDDGGEFWTQQGSGKCMVAAVKTTAT